MGYGVVEVVQGKLKLISMGVVKTSEFNTHYDKIHHIFQRTLSLVKQYNPDEVALEAPFFGKNVQSMLKLGRAQGVAMVAALSLEKQVFEYAPLKIKQAITGSGSASKEQVAYFLKSMFKIEILPKELDATDGLAAAVCHHLQERNPLKRSGASSWSDFIKKNPNKVVK
ncbi:crossover junction endodeoxyribonuclease RuvC [Halosquirtibacter laminarini]|uniref:Crossover junction endodeoxyribonuclease RuvC n=2 Tax=Halosquirtibacter laminarini TaxID=3374600 RepID=A0AC61NLJ8_9BACT|nr:crossover junction endodeoxyribonuclease RuvC [Prolixibacteraceae bacterium]